MSSFAVIVILAAVAVDSNYFGLPYPFMINPLGGIKITKY